jgi:hypothetical protein
VPPTSYEYIHPPIISMYKTIIQLLEPCKSHQLSWNHHPSDLVTRLLMPEHDQPNGIRLQMTSKSAKDISLTTHHSAIDLTSDSESDQHTSTEFFSILSSSLEVVSTVAGWNTTRLWPTSPNKRPLVLQLLLCSLCFFNILKLIPACSKPDSIEIKEYNWWQCMQTPLRTPSSTLISYQTATSTSVYEQCIQCMNISTIDLLNR